MLGVDLGAIVCIRSAVVDPKGHRYSVSIYFYYLHVRKYVLSTSIIYYLLIYHLLPSVSLMDKVAGRPMMDSLESFMVDRLHPLLRFPAFPTFDRGPSVLFPSISAGLSRPLDWQLLPRKAAWIVWAANNSRAGL